MGNPNPAPYRELPDVQILNAANDYLVAFSRLAQGLPGAGFYATLHCGAIAIELFLKAWTAEQVEVEDDGPGVAIYARAVQRGHLLVGRFASAPLPFREAFERQCRHSPVLRGLGDAPQVLQQFEGLFAASRYPFEQGHDIRRYNLEQIAACVDALARASEIRGVMLERGVDG